MVLQDGNCLFHRAVCLLGSCGEAASAPFFIAEQSGAVSEGSGRLVPVPSAVVGPPDSCIQSEHEAATVGTSAMRSSSLPRERGTMGDRLFCEGGFSYNRKARNTCWKLHVRTGRRCFGYLVSSGLVPFIITKGKSISLMETGKDILFFWVCRMSWLYESLQHSFPFDAIALHSMVVDPSGKKMSKSRGNVIDPMDIINGQTLPNLIEAITARKELSPKEKSVSVASMKRLFPKGIRNYGSDVLRLALLRYRLILCCKF